MSKTKTYLFHEISSYLPLLEGEEFDALVEDIRQFGQIEPVVLFEGKIIDGRNRYRVCKQLGIELKVREWNPSEFTGMTPLQFVISENIMRRHLNVAQRDEIGLLLLEEEEKLAEERIKQMNIEKLKLAELKKERNNEIAENQIRVVEEKIEELSKGRSARIVAPKVKVGASSLIQAKKIKQIAEKEPIIAEEWEKAKKGEQGVDAVYQKAKIIENIETLPMKHQETIKKKISSEPVSKVIEIVREKKDEQKRLEDAKKYREMQKKKREMEKLRLQIRGFENKIIEHKNAIKNINANIIVLSQEVSKKYAHFESDNPDYVLTHLGIYYDSLDMGVYDKQLKELREEYDELERPLREKLNKLEAEYEKKKNVIEEEKRKKNAEVKWVEKHRDLMLEEYDKQEFYKRNVTETEKKVKELQEKYEKEYK